MLLYRNTSAIEKGDIRWKCSEDEQSPYFNIVLGWRLYSRLVTTGKSSADRCNDEDQT